MTLSVWLPVLIIATSMSAGVIIFLLPEERHRLRGMLNLGATVLKASLVALLIRGVYQGVSYETRFSVAPGVDFVLQADSLAVLFAGLSSVLWIFTTMYAIGYLEGSPNRGRFFGFFSFCVASTLGIALAGNLFTFFLFYEMLTLSTYPLVVHRGTDRALRAGRNYLAYTLTGGAVLLLAVAWLHSIAGDLTFRAGGHFHANGSAADPALAWIFLLLIAGLGVKAAIVPLHGWLPQAMVAPAPVSALLHAVAVVKAGVFGIVRVIYDIYGIEFAAAQNYLQPLAWVVAFTILYGSLRALWQSNLKRRLAFSTVSQVSYIVLGTSLFGPLGTIGGVAHLFHQGMMKVTLFFCAGNYAETLGIHRIDELDGVGRRMPWTSMAFTVGALGMIGLPPLAGFISKWYLGMGAIEAGMPWILGVLIVSSLLNCGYFLPVIHRLWFRPQRGNWPTECPRGRHETSLWLLLPPLATCSFVILAGLLAAMPISPLYWARLFAWQTYLP
jgi:multicomponent Na+:H+ antiporter subunit D